uniref:Uncharacterized protein n=1 Tax=Setaria viridis TaxID=4556 RepID=A0A4U6UUX3_SETVI|nr:hypothetical protein SEVIR_4G083400v2 [Setaria viridis]
MKTAASHKGWHQQWFYVKNYSNSPLPEFTSRVIEVAPELWSYSPVEKEKKRITGLLQAIEYLKGKGLTRAGVIGAYHARRVAPLMLRVRSLAEMTPGAPTEGTVLATGALTASEIRQRVREALDDKDADYPVPGHPSMRLDENFVKLVGTSCSGHCPWGSSDRGRDRPRRRGGGGACGSVGGGGGERVHPRGHDGDSGCGRGEDARPGCCSGGGGRDICPGSRGEGNCGGGGGGACSGGYDGAGMPASGGGARAEAVDEASDIRGGGACPGGGVGDGGVGGGPYPCLGQSCHQRPAKARAGGAGGRTAGRGQVPGHHREGSPRPRGVPGRC